MFECYASSETQFLPLTQDLSLFTLQRYSIKYNSKTFFMCNYKLTVSFLALTITINYIIESNGFCDIFLTARRTTVQGKDLAISLMPVS
jgi:hypothetical protein